ncbi:helix-turn-helix domain-containing protein [Streptomyces sp. NPDC058001]
MADLAELFSVSRATVYRVLERSAHTDHVRPSPGRRSKICTARRVPWRVP